MEQPTPKPALNVAVFVTCLVNFIRPNIGFACVKLLQDAGAQVTVPPLQTCCGQPNYNSGDQDGARAIARQQIPLLEPYDYIVVPSGSCTGMIARHYPRLFAEDAQWHARAKAIADKTFELSHFLSAVFRVSTSSAQFHNRVAVHDSCSGLRELGIKQAPRKLLQSVEGLDLVELETAEDCCGFGGTFCVKYPEISNAMLARKIDDIVQSGVQTIVAGDLGCLLQIAGKLSREKRPIKAFHFCEILANMAQDDLCGHTEDAPS